MKRRACAAVAVTLLVLAPGCLGSTRHASTQPSDQQVTRQVKLLAKRSGPRSEQLTRANCTVHGVTATCDLAYWANGAPWTGKLTFKLVRHGNGWRIQPECAGPYTQPADPFCAMG